MNAQIDFTKSAFKYLEEAAFELAKEQGMEGQSLAELGSWMTQNMKAIAKRASEKQEQLLIKIYDNDGLRREISDRMCDRVYAGIKSNA